MHIYIYIYIYIYTRNDNNNRTNNNGDNTNIRLVTRISAKGVHMSIITQSNTVELGSRGHRKLKYLEHCKQHKPCRVKQSRAGHVLLCTFAHLMIGLSMAMMASRASHRNCSNRLLARQRDARKLDDAPITTSDNPSTRWHALVVIPREDAELATPAILGQPPQLPSVPRTRRARYPWIPVPIFSCRFSRVSEVVLAFFFNRFISDPLTTSTHASANIEDALVVASWEDTEAASLHAGEDPRGGGTRARTRLV